MTVLYELPISHYCEKVRWALAHKGLPYRRVGLLVGPHMKIAKRLNLPNTGTPILLHNGAPVQGSSAIISYLDELVPEKSLTPADTGEKKEALELESYLDQEVGVHLRRFFYHHVLDDRPTAVAMLSQGTSWYAPFFFFFAFPKIRQFMRRGMNIKEPTAALSERRLEKAITRLNELLKNKEYLVGKTFSRADLTAAALLAPLCMPTAKLT